MSQMSQLDLGACFGDGDRLDEPMTQEQFLQQTPARCACASVIGRGAVHEPRPRSPRWRPSMRSFGKACGLDERTQHSLTVLRSCDPENPVSSRAVGSGRCAAYA